MKAVIAHQNLVAFFTGCQEIGQNATLENFELFCIPMFFYFFMRMIMKQY